MVAQLLVGSKAVTQGLAGPTYQLVDVFSGSLLAGELLPQQTRTMLATMNLHPSFATMKNADGVAELQKAVPEAYRTELTAWAEAATIDIKALLLANLAVDMLCTAVVHVPDPTSGLPVTVARNMDFSPADRLGKMTVIIARRPTGRRASLSISWPGYTGVVSGMNDAGVSACLLLNHDAKRNEKGDPLGFVLRAMLEQCGTLEEAATFFTGHLVVSSNYVLLADQTTAAVVWQDGRGPHRVNPRQQWLLCTNARIDQDTGIPDDARGRHVQKLTTGHAPPDLDWMRGVLSASYMHNINAQAMILVPATRMIHLATASGVRAAALSAWHALDGARMMAGDALDKLPLTTSGPLTKPWAHYTTQK